MSSSFSPGRLEAFSDGVIAVIITIMVLELKVPHDAGWRGLHQVVPTLLVYLLSFMFTGVYWVNHHELIGRLHKCNNRILWSNLIWLFTLSLIPFFTSYVVDHDMDPFSVEVYSGCMMLAGMSFLLLRYAADCQLEREKRATGVTSGLRIKHWGSVAIYASCIALAQYYPRTALYSTSLVTLIWIVPTLGIFRGSTTQEPEAAESR